MRFFRRRKLNVVTKLAWSKLKGAAAYTTQKRKNQTLSEKAVKSVAAVAFAPTAVFAAANVTALGTANLASRAALKKGAILPAALGLGLGTAGDVLAGITAVIGGTTVVLCR